VHVLAGAESDARHGDVRRRGRQIDHDVDRFVGEEHVD
jgi:hypothetical protein